MDEAVRRTKEQTKRRQSDLREKIYELIDDNRWIKDREEREEYLDMVNDATLGIGNYEEYETKWLNGEKDVYFHHYQRFLRQVAHVPEGQDFIVDDDGNKIYIEPKEVWDNVLRDVLTDINGMAIEKATEISPEIEKKQPSSAYEFKVGEKRGNKNKKSG